MQFRPPRDGPAVSTRLRDYATAEEIGIVVAAHSFSGASLRAGAGRRMSAAAQDAALAAMWAAADRRRIGWMLTVLLAAHQICLFAKQSATYKGHPLLSAPRTEPYVRLSRIRLPPWVCNGKCLPYALQRL